MPRFQLAKVGILLLPLAGCGGGSTTSPGKVNSQTGGDNIGTSAGSVNSLNNTANNTEPADSGAAFNGTTIDGRVADGYLQGATICVDLNENGSCDENEPQTLSGSGGTYSLAIPDDAAGKPIVADVPAEAIDEDTGEPIGKKLVFSTPGDKPSFVSPITTMVHQVLKNNPSLSTSDAEAAVMGTLGLPEDEGSSLFTDYVAGSQSDDQSGREKFRFIHQTARVVASMLDEIRESVEKSATENGFDLTGDKETQKAVHKLIREEVHSLLPEISAAVASRIDDIQDASEFSEVEADLTTAFDPDRITENLDGIDTTIDVIEQLENIKSEKTATQTSMKELLAEGMYLLDIDCNRDDSDEPHDGLDATMVEPNAALLSDDSSPAQAGFAADCFADYSKAKLDGNMLIIENFWFDPLTMMWHEEFVTEYNDETPHQFVLTDGQWVPAFGDDLQEAIEFTDNGGAIVTTDLGELMVQASSTSLDNTQVLHHLLQRGSEKSMSKLVSKSDLFAGDSKVHQLTIKRRQHQYVLSNWYSYDDGSGIYNCALYNDNCNVIDALDANGFNPVQTISEIQAGSLDGIILNEIAREEYPGYRPIDFKFTAKPGSGSSLPTKGIVHWLVHDPSADQQVNNEIYHECDPKTGTADAGDSTSTPCEADFDTVGGCRDTADQSTTNEADSVSIDADSILANVEHKLNELANTPISLTTLKPPEDDYTDLPCDLSNLEPYNLLSYDDTGVTNTDREADTYKLGASEWRIITVDGVDMIDIHIPLSVRHRIDMDNTASILLIEEGGYLRRGVHFGQQSFNFELSYSQNAFETLLPIVEKYISQR